MRFSCFPPPSPPPPCPSTFVFGSIFIIYRPVVSSRGRCFFVFLFVHVCGDLCLQVKVESRDRLLAELCVFSLALVGVGFLAALS